MRKQTYYCFIGLLALGVGALAITGQSLWIDEGAAALKAMQPSLGGWWHALRSEGNSNLQLLGELFYLWGWEKIFGASEMALRASNIPFFAGGVLALAWGMAPRRAWQNAIVALGLTNAFLWYYLSEARPYIVLFAFASVTAGCLFRLLADPEDALRSSFWFGLFCLGLTGLCLTSLIAVPWALGAVSAAIYWTGPRAATRSALRCKMISGLTLTLLAALGLYYLWTMRLGARASDVGRTGWSNVAFIFYELLGISGLGPGRLELREHGVGAMAHFLPYITIGSLAVLILAISGYLALRERLTSKGVIFLLLAVAIPFMLVIAAGIAGHVRLLGRHLTPILPYLLAWLSVGLTTLLSARGKRVIGAVALFVFLWSALYIRFAFWHARDDYRDAAAIARDAVASGRRVCWLADLSTGTYYKVPFESPRVATSPMTNVPNEAPDLVILSKPDIYDSSGAARAYLAQHQFIIEQTLPAFQIWARAPAR